ncbi:MAG: hypothetical protein LBG06_05275, partial [Deltaproteobacteria bacterium]|nr:hypothetical protein [Deltaproteobacteria bacterium]
MRIKRFAARDLPAVVSLIKQEFGLAAVILSQREDPETGEVEVTAGVREEDISPLPPEGPPGAAPGGRPGDAGASQGPAPPAGGPAAA